MKSFVVAAFALLATFVVDAQVSTLTRGNDPVVLTGADLSTYSSLNPSAIVAFKYTNGTWTQIPVQVDERALLDIVLPYGPLAASSGYPPSASNPKIYFYTDASTYTGADPIATFDADDELVFMAKDAGGLFFGSSYPTGIVTGTCRQIAVTDPLGGVGYVYLFQNAGSLSQNAGTNYVSYSFNSLSGGFPANLSGVNAENSNVGTSKYSWHFSAEWVSDELKMAIGTNVDILDRYKNFFSNGSCIRHEDAFSAGENAYVTNKTGPVRVIRSYMGANSGPLTQRTHLFYEGRQDIFTDLRVHNIVGIADVFDYNSSANGMAYRNNLNTGGVTINGLQDAVTLGDISWEQISGAPGSLSILHRRATTLTASDASFSSYYDDNSSSPASNCTGDGQAWSTSGGMIGFNNGSVCTDPMASGCGVSSQWYRTLQSKRIIYIDAPNAASTTASTYNNQFNNPLQVSVSGCPGTTINYTINVSANPAAGGNASGAGTYASGAAVTVTATPNTGYSFVNWTEGTVVISTSTNYTFNVTANRTLVANFSATPPPTYMVALSSNPANAGSLGGGGNYTAGTNVTITAAANGGNIFLNWSEGGNLISANSSYSFVISNNRTFVANFTPATAVIDPLQNETVSVYPNPSRGTVFFKSLHGTEVYEVEVFNSVGQLIQKTKLAGNNPSIFVAANGYVSIVLTCKKAKTQYKLFIFRH